MKKRTTLKSLKIMVAGITVVSVATPAYSLTREETTVAPKDTTRVIDIEEVVVIATPKENNRLEELVSIRQEIYVI